VNAISVLLKVYYHEVEKIATDLPVLTKTPVSRMINRIEMIRVCRA